MEAPALEYLLEAYFHQDFYEVIGGVWETVDAFIANDAHGRWTYRQRSVESWPRCLQRTTSRRSCRAPVASTCLSRKYHGYRGWLTEIARHVEAALAKTAQN